MEAKIKFKDGSIYQAQVNGDCYILPQKPQFPEDFSELKVETSEQTKTYEQAQLIECASIDGKYWFAFTEAPVDVYQAHLDEIDMALVELAGLLAEV